MKDRKKTETKWINDINWNLNVNWIECQLIVDGEWMALAGGQCEAWGKSC